jgi:hypothetical protein
MQSDIKNEYLAVPWQRWEIEAEIPRSGRVVIEDREG